MSIRFSLNKFPADGALLSKSGVPWGCVVQPFALEDESSLLRKNLQRAEDVARCEDCFAYINGYCHVERYSWKCSLCDCYNSFSEEQQKRYGNRSEHMYLHELVRSQVDFEVAADEDGEVGGDLHTRPVYIAAVDLTGGEEFLDLVKSALLAALEALSPAALFGLVTFSHKIGLYDVQGAVPVAKYVFIPPSAEEDEELPVSLDQVMPLEAFLAPIDKNKEKITSALEGLKAATSWDRAAALGRAPEEMAVGVRGFGAAMDAVINYLGSDTDDLFVSARLCAFCSGPPDYGIGQLDSGRYGDQFATKGLDPNRVLLMEQTDFYKNLAELAVAVGVCVDLFVVSNEYTDLASLKFLSICSGGHLWLYSSADDTTLPQDIYRMLSRPHAFRASLRLRTSPEFKPARAYGNFFADAEFENVQHIVCCDPFDTYAYDLEFCNSTGFSRPEFPPFIQMAFQYTVLIPVEAPSATAAAEDGGGKSSNESIPLSEDGKARNAGSSAAGAAAAADVNGAAGSAALVTTKYVLKRRLRVKTVQIPVAHSPAELYEASDPEVILTLLTHKIIRASLEEGVKEGRLLLQDWLVILTAQYNDYYKTAKFGDVGNATVDVEFENAPKLQPLPRVIFAMLRSPLLKFHEEGVHPDYRTYLQCLYSSLDPSYLLRAVYPLLSSYKSPNEEAYPQHSLSRAALVTSGSPIFLLDAFTTLVVYYAPSAPPTLPFPPPQASVLKQKINKLKQERIITPKLINIQGGHQDADQFHRYLIEEQDVDGTTSSLGLVTGFVGFLERIGQEVREYMK